MAWSGTGAGAESAFRHPLKAMTRLSQRTPLRIKLIAALLALVALALTVISFTSIVVFRGYLLNQADNQVQRLVGQSTNSPPPSPHQSDSYTFLGFVYEVVDSQGNLVSYFGNGQTLGSAGPDVPTSSSWLSAHAGHPVTVPALSGSGQWRIIEQPVTYPSQDGTTQYTGTLVIGDNLGNINHTIGYLTGLDVIVSLVIMLGLGVVSVAVVRTNLRSLDDIEETARRSPPAIWTAASRSWTRGPKSGGSAGRSTRCWPRSSRRSTTGRNRKRRRSSPRSGCAASSRTRATNCARR